MLEFRSVTKKYDYVTALMSVSFKAEPQEIVGLIGANGAGKTTSIQLISRYISPDEGEIYLNGESIQSIAEDRFNISYIPDEPIYYDFMTVAEHLEFITSMYPGGVYGILELIDRFSLSEHMKKTPHALSKGNKQKLMICCALLREFDYLIADEPFTGLDPRQINTLKQILIELKSRGKGILLSTHLLDVIELFCDRYIMLDRGSIIAEGTREELAQSSGLSADLSIEEMYISLTDYYGEGLHGDDLYDDEE